MGWYDPPDDIVKTKEATIWESEFSVIANMQVLATKEDDLDQLITENLAEKFDAGWFNINDMEASVEDKKDRHSVALTSSSATGATKKKKGREIR